MGVRVVLLAWRVAPGLLLRQLSLKMRHQSRCLLVRLLRRHHLLPHSLLQQTHDTELQQYAPTPSDPVCKHPQFSSNRQYIYLGYGFYPVQ
jgi:hypothetical protein